MSHFSIILPGNIQGDVRQGKVFTKRAGLLKQWPWLRVTEDERVGYVVSIEAATGNSKKEYHLLKTKDGSWGAATRDTIDLAVKTGRKWQPVEEDQITLAIKKAIDDYENKQ